MLPRATPELYKRDWLVEEDLSAVSGFSQTPGGQSLGLDAQPAFEQCMAPPRWSTTLELTFLCKMVK